jgi:hypothetical protein
LGNSQKNKGIKNKKNIWDEEAAEDDILAISVDGVHFWCYEPSHPIYIRDKKAYSHKFNHAGWDYEVGISLSRNQVMWLSGPHPAGNNDISIFKTQGLLEELKKRKQKAIADGGYNGPLDYVCTPNAHNNEGVKLFKRRALQHHETFNGLLKHFNILNTRFRHNRDRFAVAFEAVCTNELSSCMSFSK